ncbi:MAG TPA: secretin N-terminal domain-containing protein, partial [Planctomycetia bacterium]|nr:secretin N-terminal domain-containing protein [Planctomycetia bacterium]
ALTSAPPKVEAKAAPEKLEFEGKKSDKPPVTLLIGPDSIMVHSDDPAALDAAEKLVRQFIGGPTPPPSNLPVVYRLTSADASETATLLDSLLYGQQQQRGGFNPFFGGQREESPLKAKIVADTRTNSLIVQATQGEHRKIKALLEILDDDAPETDIQPEARPISLKWASATRVADQLREIYSPIIFGGQNQQQQNQQQQGGPGGFGGARFGFGGGPFGGGGFGGPFGGGQGGNNNRRGGAGGDPKKMMTLSVDEVSNTLLVSASKAIFDDVERTAMGIDELARTSNQQVTVVTVKNARPEVVQKALNELFGVRINEPTNTTSATGGAGGGGPGAGMNRGGGGGNRGR